MYMSKRNKAFARLDRIEETLTFIRALYTPEQKAKAVDMVMELEGERATLCGQLGLVRKEA